MNLCRIIALITVGALCVRACADDAKEELRLPRGLMSPKLYYGGTSAQRTAYNASLVGRQVKKMRTAVRDVTYRKHEKVYEIEAITTIRRGFTVFWRVMTIDEQVAVSLKAGARLTFTGTIASVMAGNNSRDPSLTLKIEAPSFP